MFPTTFERTRLAPTPSGFLHLGNILSFAITAAVAGETGAKILLRIDDLDQLRVNREYIEDIFNTLEFLRIPYHEGPKDAIEFEQAYSQMHRMDAYSAALSELVARGFVFACTCSRQQVSSGVICRCYEKKLPLETENASWRLLTKNAQLEINDLRKGVIKAFLPVEMENFVVRKKDGFPAYQLTSLVDDLFYGVGLVVRGQDLWSSTLAQHTLAHMLGKGNIFKAITFYHHPLIMDANGKKLSKSAGATSIKYLRGIGMSPAEVYTLIAKTAAIDLPVKDWEHLGAAMIHHLNTA